MCDCRKFMDAKLAALNARIAVGFTFDDARMDVAPPMIVLEKVDEKRRGKLPNVLASCCPFCGEKYPEDAP